MRAVFVDYAEPPVAVAKRHQILSQQPHANRRTVGFGDFLGQAGGEPMLPHQLAHCRVAFDAT